MTTVLVVEDQQVLASALEIAIGAQPDLDCMGSAATVADALALMATRVPDVVLMDVELPGPDGIDGTRRVRAAYPGVRVLILTAGATPGRLAEAATAGASGFLAKDSALPDILAAIRNPMAGKMVIEGAVLGELIAQGRPRTAAAPPGAAAVPPGTTAVPPGTVIRPAENAERAGEVACSAELAKLTAREQEVLALMGEGLDPAAIAEHLVVSVYTARGHVKNVMMKLGAHTQLEAVVLATKAGLLPPPR